MAQTMKYINYSPVNQPLTKTVTINGSGNSAFRNVTVMVDGSAGSSTKNLPWLFLNPVTGQYAPPGATVYVSQIEFDELYNYLAKGVVTNVEIFYGAASAPGGPSPVTEFAYRVSEVVAALAEFDIRIARVEHDLKHEIAGLKGDIRELKKLIHPPHAEAPNPLS